MCIFANKKNKVMDKQKLIWLLKDFYHDMRSCDEEQQDNVVEELIEKITDNNNNGWHIQEEDDIYDAVNDWTYYTFICLMKDKTIQEFSGILAECDDGTINRHVDSINDNYSVDDIMFWIEATNLNYDRLSDLAKMQRISG